MEKFWESFVLFRETSMLIRTLTTLSLAAMLIACGGGSSSSNNNNNGGGGGTVDDNGGVNGTYAGNFTTDAALSFTVTAHFTQPAAPGSPISGTAVISAVAGGTLPACLGAPGTTLNVSGAEASGGGLQMALLNGAATNGAAAKIDLPSAGSPDTAFPDTSNNMDQSFAGPFSIENCPGTTGTSAGIGTSVTPPAASLTRTGP
jgi:hypothetical protein